MFARNRSLDFPDNRLTETELKAVGDLKLYLKEHPLEVSTFKRLRTVFAPRFVRRLLTLSNTMHAACRSGETFR